MLTGVKCAEPLISVHLVSLIDQLQKEINEQKRIYKIDFFFIHLK
jgi:hypothetical protein